MQLSKQELIDLLNDKEFYDSLLPDAQKMTDKTLGGFLKDSSQNIDLAYDALLDSIERIIIKIKAGTYESQGAETIKHHKNQIKKYVNLSINSYLVDRSRRWGSDIKTNAPAARARKEAPSDSSHEEFFDKIHQDVYTRTSKSKFKEGALEDLISKANLSDDEKWIVRIRSSDMKLSECIGREKLLPIDQNAMLSTCREIENEKPEAKQKSMLNCTCRFVEMSFLEIEQKYGGKSDTYRKRYRKAVDKLRSVAENA